ncbi:MAG: hypothetical protein M1829_003756 [Trizodia sp. TS-e1964]|nr:MAG: hypothetical protein M1829_003756 [Trizodia sp. TS-e1964]
MPYNLKGRNVLVTGGSRGLGATIVEKFAAEGCNVVFSYISNGASASKVIDNVKSKYPDVGVHMRRSDVGVKEDCQDLVKETIEVLGGIDVIISNAGWTMFCAFEDLDTPTEEDWDKCWAINVKANLHLLKAALPTFKANPDGGVFLITSSVTASTPGSGSSMPYSVSKAAGLHLMKCLAASQGPKVRVNAVLPGLLLTDWGEKFGEEKINAIKERSVLKKETELEDCADAFVMAARNSSLTGQGIQVDSGLFQGSASFR